MFLRRKVSCAERTNNIRRHPCSISSLVQPYAKRAPMCALFFNPLVLFILLGRSARETSLAYRLFSLFSFQANKNLTSQRIGASQQRFFHRSITCLDVLLRVVPLRVLRCEGSPRQRIKDNLQDGRPNKKSSRTSYALVDGSSQISTVAKSKGILVSIFKVAKLLIEVCYGSLTRAPRKL